LIKKTITYKDYNENEVTETFYFNLSEADLIELEVSKKGGLGEALKKVIAAEDNETLYAEFKKILLMSYGKRSDDGRRFIKNKELRDEFESTGAFPKLVMLLATDTDFATDFINGLMPKGMVEELTKQAEATSDEGSPEVPDKVVMREPKVLTRAEIEEMSQEEFQQLGVKLASGEVVIGTE
jgi:hypothetical protein